MSHGLLLWLENIDRRKNEIVPISPNLDSDTLQDHHRLLMVEYFCLYQHNIFLGEPKWEDK